MRAGPIEGFNPRAELRRANETFIRSVLLHPGSIARLEAHLGVLPDDLVDRLAGDLLDAARATAGRQS